jgi:signal transduction histidine kinase
MSSGSDIDARVGIIGRPRRLGTDVEVALLRIAQEALRNVVRHAGASVAAITLEFGPAGVCLRIADDGAGMDPIPAPLELLRGNHLGLIGMQERARMVGGSIDFRQAALGGLEVVVDLDDDRPGDTPAAQAGSTG